MSVPNLHRLSSRLKLRHFALLAEIDRQRSISRAAERLDLAQPTVTRALSEIEGIFMTPLFVRSRKGLEPTPAGDAVLARARLALANAAALEQDLAALAAGFQGTLRIGVIPFLSTMAHDALWDYLLALTPPVRCVLEESTTNHLLEGVRNGHLDCAICRFSSPRPGDGLLQERLYQQEPRLVVSAAAAPHLAKRGLDWAAFARMRWILPPRHTPIGEMIKSIFASAAQPIPAPVLEAYAQKTLASVLRKLPDGITILPDDVAVEVAQASGACVLPQRLQWHLPPVGMVRREDVPNAELIAGIARVVRAAAGANRRHGNGD